VVLDETEPSADEQIHRCPLLVDSPAVSGHAL
jgi:hypothetical protein